MDYRISDISNIFQISKEMVRYYEKQGAISSIRKEENNYRIYSIWDIFNFLDFLQYKKLGISAKELVKIKETQFSKNMKKYLKNSKQELDEEIRYKCVLRNRMEELLERMECCEYNEQNYWVKRIPGRYMYHFLTSEDDTYGEIEVPLEIRKQIFSDHLMPMMDPCIEFQEKNEWWYSVSEKYAEILDEVCLENATYVAPQICLCSVVNMGEIGEFTSGCLEAARNYMKQKGYKQDGAIRGVLIGRGKEERGYIRRMEIQIPIKI